MAGLVIGLVAGLAAGIVHLARRRRAADRRSSPAGAARSTGRDSTAVQPGGAGSADPIEALRTQAAAALVTLDDAIRSCDQAVGCARAEVGQDGAEPFAAAVDQSRAELAEALSLHERGPDSGTPDAEHAWLADIVSRCQRADARLDDLATRFDALRNLDRRLAEVLTGLEERHASLERKHAEATSTADALAAQYPRGTLASLFDDLDQAGARLRFAHSCLAIGQQRLSDADRAGALARARAAEQALGQARSLLDWAEVSPKVLGRAREVVATLLSEAQRDIEDAERLGVTDHLAANGKYARDTLGWAGDEVASGEYDPLAMRRALEDTNAALGQALGPVRAEDETQERAVAVLASAWFAARATLGSADRYITTRRGAIGVQARSRLSEARAAYADGVTIGDGDPPAALAQLRRADVLAEQARELAQQDEAVFRNARQLAGGMDELGTMVLGGILIEPAALAPAQAAPAQAARRAHGPGPVSFGGSATRGRLVGSESFLP